MCVRKQIMVTYYEVGKRHAVYASVLVVLALCAEHTLMTTGVLLAMLVAVNWHMGSSRAFAAAVSLLGPVGASVCVNASHHTWWYAHGIPIISVPLWLFPLHGIFAHWILDMYWVVTLKEVRKATLP